MRPSRSKVTTNPDLGSSGRAWARGRRTSTPPCMMGAVIMKMMSSTNATSTSDVTLISAFKGSSPCLRGHGELPLNADINVTSLVDVAFVLLIIFMITAPIMQGGVDVRLPRAQARPLEPKSGLVVTLDRDGRIYMEQAALSYDDFRATFPAFVRTKRPTGVYLRADGRVPYADVVQVLAVIRASGVNDVGLVAEPETVER